MLRRNSFLTRGFVCDAVCICSALLFAAAFLFSGCTEIADSSSSSSSASNSTITEGSTGTTTSGTTTTASTSASWAYSSSSPVFEVDSDVSSVSVSGLTSGQTIYLARTNVSSTTIGSSYARYVSAAANVTLSSGDSSSSSSTSGFSGGSGSGTAPVHFIAPVALRPSQFTRMSSSARTAALSASAAVTPLTLTVGTTTKDLYVDQDADISTFAAETATLRATGTYCNVWVVSDNFTTGTASGEKIDATIAQSLADKFDAIYPMVRNVFGDESEHILLYDSGSITTDAISNYDDTGTYTVNSTSGDKVNIVVYDIGADYSSSSSSGIVGYFYAKDYYKNTGSALSSTSGYKVIDYSNCGKYFYIDAYYAVSYTDTVYSTLAHEFQHMVNFGVKEIDKNLSPDTWYNEMLSMLSEDMMQSYLGLNTSDYDDSPEDRLPLFERCYKDVGLEYRSSSTYLTLLSYSNSFAFGAWIARQFGGANVIAAMSSNNYVDTASVVAAVNSVNGTSYTMEDLLKMYAEACIFSDTTLCMPTFNTSQTLDSADSLYYTSESYGYPISSIDLWNLGNMFSTSFTSSYSSSTYYKYTGPYLYGYNAQYEIRPYGMTLCKAGTTTSATATITLSTTGSSNERVYIMIQ